MLPPFIYWLLVVMWGLCLGSFTTCIMYRVPRGLSLWRLEDGSQQSFCPVCKTPLRVPDLIPVFSWLLQKGRCRYCGAKIGAFYPMVELSVLAAVMILAFFLTSSLWIFPAAFIVPGVVAVFGLLKRFSKI